MPEALQVKEKARQVPPVKPPVGQVLRVRPPAARVRPAQSLERRERTERPAARPAMAQARWAPAPPQARRAQAQLLPWARRAAEPYEPRHLRRPALPAENRCFAVLPVSARPGRLLSLVPSCPPIE